MNSRNLVILPAVYLQYLQEYHSYSVPIAAPVVDIARLQLLLLGFTRC